jgi:glycosyltransferase involved in cell wall biosynthesis
MDSRRPSEATGARLGHAPAANGAVRSPRRPSDREGGGRSIRVLHIINDLSRGGAEMMLYKLVSRTDREAFAPTVISLTDRSELRERIQALGIPVSTPEMTPSIATPASVWRLLRLVRHVDPDVIHGWMYHGSLAAQLAHHVSAPRARVVWGIRNSLGSATSEKTITAAVIRLCAKLSARPARVVFVSRVNRAQHEAMGYSATNGCVIPNGFDTSLFAPSHQARRAVCAELGLPHDALLIGLVGRFHPVKDHESFLRAAAILAADCPRVRFVLCGKRVEWSTPFFRTIVGELGIGDRVRLLGERPDMPRLTAALDIASSSSLNEGFPNVIGEAMACGVPCVTTSVGESPAVVGETGRVIPPRDPRALAAAWKEIIALGPGGRQALGQAARRRIVECFSLTSAVDQYEALYRAVAPSIEACSD